MEVKKIIENAIRAAKQDGYDQVVYRDGGGVYWFGRDYSGRAAFPDEKILGHVRVGWTRGVLAVQYIPA